MSARHAAVLSALMLIQGAARADRPNDRLADELRAQVSRAHGALINCGRSFDHITGRPRQFEVELSEDHGKQAVKLYGDNAIRAREARRRLLVCVTRAVTAQRGRFRVRRGELTHASSGHVVVELPAEPGGGGPRVAGGGDCDSDADCELVCPTAVDCCAGLCGPCQNAVPKSKAAAVREAAHKVCKPCAVDCKMAMQTSRAACVEHRCQARLSGGPGSGGGDLRPPQDPRNGP